MFQNDRDVRCAEAIACIPTRLVKGAGREGHEGHEGHEGREGKQPLGPTQTSQDAMRRLSIQIRSKFIAVTTSCASVIHKCCDAVSKKSPNQSIRTAFSELVDREAADKAHLACASAAALSPPSLPFPAAFPCAFLCAFLCAFSCAFFSAICTVY